MTKSEFLSQLSYKLRVLPESERRDALEYYEGYISDAGDEAAAIAQLGHPGEVAATILANYVSQGPTHESPGPAPGRTKIRTAYIAILAIFALPIGLPLAAAAFGLIVALFSVVFAAVVTGIALVFAGGMILISAPFAAIHDFWFGVFMGGVGFASLGLGILAFKGTVKLIGGFPAIVRAIRRRSHRGAPATDGYGYHQSTAGHSGYNNSNSMPLPTQETGGFYSGHSHHGSADTGHGNQQPYGHPPARPLRRAVSIRMALIFVILGAVMFMAAWLNGARGGAIVIENGRPRFQVAGSTRNEDLHEVALAPLSFSQVNIRSLSNNVVILPSNTAEARYSGTPNVDINIENGVLNITPRGSGTRVIHIMDVSFAPRDTREIRLYLPPAFLVDDGGHIRVQTTSGNIRVEGDFASLNAVALSGRINVRDNTNSASTAYIRTTSGNITVDNVNHVDRLAINALSGRININGVSWHNLDARTTSGNINIMRSRAEASQNAQSHTQIRALSGNLNVSLLCRRDDFSLEMRTTSGAIRVNGDRLANRGSVNLSGGSNTINAHATSGNINLDFGR